jgi:general stress protein 26
MAQVGAADRKAFFEAVEAASRKAIWAAVATLDSDAARVRIVHPTWEGETLWFATGTGSPKHRQLESNGNVELQYQVAPPDFVHVVVTGRATIVTDAAEKKRVWDVIDYDLGQFWPGGPTDPSYTLVRVDPTRVELSELFGSRNKRVWRAPR